MLRVCVGDGVGLGGGGANCYSLFSVIAITHTYVKPDVAKPLCKEARDDGLDGWYATVIPNISIVISVLSNK